MGKPFLAALLLSASLAVAGRAATLPRPAPDIPITLTDGQQLHLASYKGKVVVLAFILTTCSHCQRTTGFLVPLQNEYGPRGVQVIECAIEQMARVNVPGFVKTYGTNFPVGFNTDVNAVLEFLQHPPMLVPHMPLLAFIDRQGQIRAQYEGSDGEFFGPQHEQNLRKQVDALLAESVPAAKKPAPKKAVHPAKKPS